MSEAKFGILPAVIGPYVVNAVGKRNARYLALTTTRIDANTALSMGMVQRVVSADALDAEVDRVVTELVAGFEPRHVALEQTIYVQNFQTAQILGAARGAEGMAQG